MPSPGDGSGMLDLDQIRSSLIRQEETIIFALIERAQFCQNAATSELNHPAFTKVLNDSVRTFLDHMLLEHERLHASVRRYTAPEEHAFFPSKLPAPSLDTLPTSVVLHPNAINVNDQIKAIYLTRIVPSVCPPGDDTQYGSATLCDITVLQALSKRIHYGKFVAESKFRSQPEEYTRLIQARDADGIMELLTNAAVEAKLLRRVHAKASAYGQDIEGAPGERSTQPAYKVDPELIVALYRDHIIPLTKEVEVLYLLERLGGCHVAHADARSRRAAEAHFSSKAPAPGLAQAVTHVPCTGVSAALATVLSGKVCARRSERARPSARGAAARRLARVRALPSPPRGADRPPTPRRPPSGALRRRAPHRRDGRAGRTHVPPARHRRAARVRGRARGRRAAAAGEQVGRAAVRGAQGVRPTAAPRPPGGVAVVHRARGAGGGAARARGCGRRARRRHGEAAARARPRPPPVPRPVSRAPAQRRAQAAPHMRSATPARPRAARRPATQAAVLCSRVDAEALSATVLAENVPRPAYAFSRFLVVSSSPQALATGMVRARAKTIASRVPPHPPLKPPSPRAAPLPRPRTGACSISRCLTPRAPSRACSRCSRSAASTSRTFTRTRTRWAVAQRCASLPNVAATRAKRGSSRRSSTSARAQTPCDASAASSRRQL